MVSFSFTAENGFGKFGFVSFSAENNIAFKVKYSFSAEKKQSGFGRTLIRIRAFEYLIFVECRILAKTMRISSNANANFVTSLHITI